VNECEFYRMIENHLRYFYNSTERRCNSRFD
jgi:hypothetical protein